MKLIPWFLALWLAGCAPTLSGIRASNPDAVLNSDRSPKSLANCIYYEAQGENDKFNAFWNRVEMTENDGSYHLSLFAVGGFLATQTIPIAEITVKPDPASGSRVELRSHNAPVRTGPQRALACIRQCAGPQNNPGATVGLK